MQEAEAYRADSLAFVLSQLYGLDQGVRMLGLRGEEVAAIRRADSLTFGQFLAFVSEYGFPTAELVGEDNFSRECVCMLGYVVMLHNPHRLLEPETFRLLCGEVRAGRLNPEVFGWALDRYFVTYEGYSLFNSPYRAVRALQGVPRASFAARFGVRGVKRAFFWRIRGRHVWIVRENRYFCRLHDGGVTGPRSREAAKK